MIIDPYLIMSEQWMPWKQRVYSLIKKNEIHSITGITSLYHAWSISVFLISIESLNAGKSLYQHSILEAGESKLKKKHKYNARWIQLIWNERVKNNCRYIEGHAHLKYLLTFLLIYLFYFILYAHVQEYQMYKDHKN